MRGERWGWIARRFHSTAYIVWHIKFYNEMILCVDLSVCASICAPTNKLLLNVSLLTTQYTHSNRFSIMWNTRTLCSVIRCVLLRECEIVCWKEWKVAIRTTWIERLELAVGALHYCCHSLSSTFRTQIFAATQPCSVCTYLADDSGRQFYIYVMAQHSVLQIGIQKDLNFDAFQEQPSEFQWEKWARMPRNSWRTVAQHIQYICGIRVKSFNPYIA